jgi:hypothetical protein
MTMSEYSSRFATWNFYCYVSISGSRWHQTYQEWNASPVGGDILFSGLSELCLEHVQGLFIALNTAGQFQEGVKVKILQGRDKTI